ncbi:MAG: carboxypeptidase-like regulatory domain-containing protein [Acidobacteriota bacterium]
MPREDSKESGAAASQAKALWVFGASVVPNPVSDAAGRARLVADSSASGFDRLFVSVYQGTPNSSGRLMYTDSDMAALNTAAHAAGQQVWAAYGAPDWPGFACDSGAFPVQRMAEVAAFNAVQSASERFDGVMLDVEPTITTEAQYQSLIRHYQCMRASLPSSVKLGVAINAFWDMPVVYPATGGTLKPAYQHIIDLDVDSVVVMGYRDTAGTDVCPSSDGLICLDLDEINYASSINKVGRVLVGLETLDVVPEPPKVTFFQEGHVSLAVESRKAASYFASSVAFGGFAIHNYTSMYLKGTADWPSPETAGSCSLATNVEVESSGGTTLSGYPTIKTAFDAVNAGTHTGTISIEICASTSEGTTPATLNSSGAGAASYASIYINPLVDGASITGNPATGFGVIQLKGADNVTIDGDNPNSPGVNRDLMIGNTNTATATFGSVLRIANPTPAASSSDNISFKNLLLNGNVTAGNSTLITSSGSSSDSSFGIYVGGRGGATATDAPLGIDDLASRTIPANTTVNNFVVENNAITQTGRSIAFNGNAVAQSNDVTVTGNHIGNAVAGAAAGVYSMGVTVQGTSSLDVSDNTIYIESYLNAGLSGIDVGSNNPNVSGVTIERNKILRVRNNNTITRGAFGINLVRGNGHTVRNNFVAEIANDQTAGSGSFGTTSGAFGIRLAAGTGHRIYHNSVHLTGTIPGSIQTNVTAAFMILGGAVAGADVRNNIFSNQLTGGNPAGTRHAAIMLPSGAGSSMNLTLNNNAYYQGRDAKSRLAQVGSILGNGEYEAANFNPNDNATASNFRAYSNTLSGDATNDNSSFASSSAPPFVSATDLHAPAGSLTPLESAGAAVGVVNDIDLTTRNATNPDIGADEFLAPSAANVSLGGRVMTQEGYGIRNATVTLAGGDLDTPRTAITGPFGYYIFGELRVGLTYVLTVRSKRYEFADPTRVINLDDQITSLDFTAEPPY